MSNTFESQIRDFINGRSVGFSDLFNVVDSFKSDGIASNYPKYNLGTDGNKSFIEVAVAGFDRSELSVKLDKSRLTIEGKRASVDSNRKYTRKDIASRDFKTVFEVREFYEVNSVTLVNGILTVELVKNVPEDKEVKVFDIG